MIAPKPDIRSVNLIVQIMAGIGMGTCADYVLQVAGFDALLRFKVIHLADAFSGIYLPDAPQQILDVAVFAVLAVGFAWLRRWPRIWPVANASLVTHCLIGGVYTLLRFFID